MKIKPVCRFCNRMQNKNWSVNYSRLFDLNWSRGQVRCAPGQGPVEYLKQCSTSEQPPMNCTLYDFLQFTKSNSCAKKSRSVCQKCFSHNKKSWNDGDDALWDNGLVDCVLIDSLAILEKNAVLQLSRIDEDVHPICKFFLEHLVSQGIEE